MNNIEANVRQWYDIAQQELAQSRARVQLATNAYELAAAQAQALCAVAQALARLLDLLHDIDDRAFRSGLKFDDVYSTEAVGLGPTTTPSHLEPGEYKEDDPPFRPLTR